MGIRPNRYLAAIPISIEDGVAIIELSGLRKEFSIPALKGLSFSRQCNQLLDQLVAAYLSNGKYGVVLRFDGTGSLFLQEGKVFVKGFMYLPFNFGKIWISKIGALSVGFGEAVAFYVYSIQNQIYVLTDCNYRSFVLSGKAREWAEQVMGYVEYSVNAFYIQSGTLFLVKDEKRIPLECEAVNNSIVCVVGVGA